MGLMNAKKKILLYVGVTSYIGGPKLNAIEVGKLLSQAGANVTIATLNKTFSPNQLAVMDSLDIKIVSTPFTKNMGNKYIRNIYALISWFFKIGIKSQDIVVCMGHGGFHFLMKIFVKREGMLIHRETGAGGIPSGNQNLFFYKYLKLVDAILALSKSSKINIEKDWPTKALIKMIPELIPDIVKDFKRNKLMENDPILRIGYIGRVEKNKGLKELISIWSQLKIQPAILEIYGYGEESFYCQIRDLIDRLKLKSEIYLMGPYLRNNLTFILPHLDMLVLLSKSEGLPTTLIEGLSFGVPFVATDVGCIKDIAEKNLDVEVVVNDEEMIIEAIERMADKIRNQKINPRNIQKFYKSYFDFEIVSKQWITALLKTEKYWHNMNKEI